jgi:hypothetical protein
MPQNIGVIHFSKLVPELKNADEVAGINFINWFLWE